MTQYNREQVYQIFRDNKIQIKFFEYLNKYSLVPFHKGLNEKNRPLFLWDEDVINGLVLKYVSGNFETEYNDFKLELSNYQRKRAKLLNKIKIPTTVEKTIKKVEEYTDAELDEWDYVPHKILSIRKIDDDHYAVKFQKTPDSDIINSTDSLEQVKNKINNL